MRMACKIPCIGTLGLLAAVASCSDAVPPASTGAASLHLSAPTDPTSMCQPGVHWANAPFPGEMTMNQPQVSASSKGKLATDGEGGASVSCSVKANGSKFDIVASITGPLPADPSTGSRRNPTSMSFQVTLGAGDSGVDGLVTIIDDKTANLFTSNPSGPSAKGVCSFGTVAIAAGRVWGSVSCINVRNAGTPNTACDINPTGYFVFENCAQ